MIFYHSPTQNNLIPDPRENDSVHYHQVDFHCLSCGDYKFNLFECGTERIYAPVCEKCLSPETVIEKISHEAVFPFSKTKGKNVHE